MGRRARERNRPRRSPTKGRLRHALFVGHHRPAQGGQARITSISRSTLPNPFLADARRQNVRLDADSIYLSPAPLYHAAPLRFNMMAVQRWAAPSSSWRTSTPRNRCGWSKSTRSPQPQLVPTMFVRMLKLPREVRTKLRRLVAEGRVHAAAPCPVEVKAEDDRMVGTDPDRILRRHRRQRRHRVDLAAMADPSRHRRPRGSRQDQDNRRERSGIADRADRHGVFRRRPGSSPITTIPRRRSAPTTPGVVDARRRRLSSTTRAISISPTASPT